jgi:hypothetical protein
LSIPIENHSDQGQFAESAENNGKTCKIWAIIMQFAVGIHSHCRLVGVSAADPAAAMK